MSQTFRIPRWNGEMVTNIAVPHKSEIPPGNQAYYACSINSLVRAIRGPGLFNRGWSFDTVVGQGVTHNGLTKAYALRHDLPPLLQGDVSPTLKNIPLTPSLGGTFMAAHSWALEPYNPTIHLVAGIDARGKTELHFTDKERLCLALSTVSLALSSALMATNIVVPDTVHPLYSNYQQGRIGSTVDELLESIKPSRNFLGCTLIADTLMSPQDAAALLD